MLRIAFEGNGVQFLWRCCAVGARNFGLYGLHYLADVARKANARYAISVVHSTTPRTVVIDNL